MRAQTAAPDKRIESIRRRIRSLPIPRSNRKAVLAFSDSCFSEGLSTGRVLKYLYTLNTIAEKFPKEFHTATRADIEELVHGIERSGYSAWTKRDFRITLKKFYRWLRQTDDCPPEVKWLRSTVRNKRTKLPEEILTQEEVQAMITAAPAARDKALIAALYESGCRIGELLPLRIKQIQQRPHGFQITVKSMKRARRLLLIACAPYIAAWMNGHPRREDPQAPLWATADYRAKQLGYERACTILKSAARRAGVRKKVNPHNFRHSRATHLARHMTEAQMKEYFGWVQDSDMASTYVHLSGRDIDYVLLKINNIPVREEDQPKETFSLKACPRCSIENPPANKFCSRCGWVLDEGAARELARKNLVCEQANDIMDSLLDDPEFRSVLARKLHELGSPKP